MAKKISQLTQATEVKSDDVTVIVQDGETKKLPLNMMVTKQDIENKKVAGLAKLDEIEATYENDTYTPTITVKNKSSVKTGEGDEVDYSANVMDGHVKSAILKGQTKYKNIDGQFYDDLNIFQSCLKLVGKNIDGGGGIYDSGVRNTVDFVAINEDSKVKLSGLTLKNLVFYDGDKTLISVVGVNTTEEYVMNIPVGARFFRFSYDNTVDLAEASITISTLTIQSVKLPVLTTTGKNLFDVSKLEGLHEDIEMIPNGIRVKNIQIDITRCFANPFKENTQYTFSFNHTQIEGEGREGFRFYYTDGTSSYVIPNSNSSFVGRSLPNKTIKSISLSFNNLGKSELTNIQLEEGTTSTSYEPYKSNILTVNEDVELRGIGNMQDTLDLVTGELTQCIGEIVLDGSDDEGYTINGSITSDGLTRFIVNVDIPNRKQRGNAISNLLPTVNNSSSYGVFNGVGLNIIINCSTVDELRTWLQQNPVTIQYELTQESVKTVDLMPSGTHPSTTPYCWKNGHIQLSSSGLLPNLEYSVVTSRAGQINQNATMVVKNDKRIFDLEILLAGGLVNTTYQALTLQNQVETGLSKVSLSSETEPDYLLYHMIMKLIEEKAYKLDDLTEKVSVFYLYEKLSDEQFETIYSALYPFVEDEIVEEPVVEELPEVVEDEVIM